MNKEYIRYMTDLKYGLGICIGLLEGDNYEKHFKKIKGHIIPCCDFFKIDISNFILTSKHMIYETIKYFIKRINQELKEILL